MRKQLREQLDKMFKEIDEEGKRSVFDNITLNHEIDKVTILYQKHGVLVIGSEGGNINVYHYEGVHKVASPVNGTTYWALSGDSEHADFHGIGFIDKGKIWRRVHIAYFPKFKKWLRKTKREYYGEKSHELDDPTDEYWREAA